MTLSRSNHYHTF